MRISEAVLLPTTIHDAWWLATRWERQPEWMVDAADVRIADRRREGPGVVVLARTKVLGLPVLTEALVIQTWEPPKRLVLVRRGFVRGRGEWRFEPDAAGTRFVWTEELSLAVPFLGELALGVYRPIMRRLMRRSLSNLRDLLR